MKDSIRNTVYGLMKYAGFRKLVQLPIAFGNLFRKELIRYKRDRKSELEERLWKEVLKEELVVRQGPFAGMVYPEFISFNSARLPKLLGTYESEIYADLEKLLSQQPDLVIDIGAADGYYAVGIARRLPNAEVRCFDLNPVALAFCKRMSDANNTQNLSIETLFHPEYFEDLSGRKALLIVDIDGGEKPLFTKKAVASLSGCSLIIETHDYLDPTITSGLIQLFEQTHNIKTIHWSTDKSGEVPAILSQRSNEEKRGAMLERIVDNKWLIIEPK